MMKRWAGKTYNFFVELILAILVLFLVYYIPVDQFPPLLLLFVSCFGTFFIVLFLLNKFAGKANWIYFICVFPILQFLGSFTSIPLIQIALLGLFIYWRGYALFKQNTVVTNNVFLFIFILTGISITFFAGASDYKYQNVIIILFFLEIMLVLMGLFISKWSAIDENRGKFMLYFGGFLAGAAMVGVVITFGLKLARFVISGIGLVVAYGLSYILRFGYFTVHYFGDLFGIKPRQESHPEDADYNTKYFGTRVIKQLHDNPTWLGLFLFAAILVIAFYIYKKRKKVVFAAGDNASLLQISEEVSLNKGGFFFKKRAKPPKDQVRSEIFFLERFASKLKLGRRPFESLPEWWARIGIKESGELSKIYENVRYGEVSSSTDDVSKVKVEIIQIKHQLKEKN